jgi:surface antigen
MKRIVSVAMALLLAGSAGGCAEQDETGLGAQIFFTGVGAVAGGLLGVVVGSGSGRIVSIGVGAALGGVGGFFAAPYLASLGDREAAAKAAEEALAQSTKDGEIVSWTNSESGNGGTFRPLSTRTASMGREICRDLQVTIEANGDFAVGKSVACRPADGGAWVFKNA